MTTAEQDYWIAEGRIRQLNDDLQTQLATAIAAVETVMETARKELA